MPTCPTCRFGVPLNDSQTKCYFNPPNTILLGVRREEKSGAVIGHESISIHPIMGPKDFCGKFEEKEDAQ